ncbi:MAG: 16S rRNA (cytosine(1402)-N(4))-methyltransferase RsmH [Blastochloris viridis]|uniref:Ribosomal RNA small subunit methyltransferase H n=1 Tax=Blastochloris viridis TaxID=1079 RepID=A0A6N4RAH6_BLAVI|nr:MAG: 16S rRNA (cytosine(1402)-N(4))-methyltransferase RsmH [Blastochloris viridis]
MNGDSTLLETRGTAETVHVPVLFHEVMDALEPAAGKLLVDGTLGGGGHTRGLLERGAEVVGLDWDSRALVRCAPLVETFGDRVHLVRAAYDTIPEVLAGPVLQNSVTCGKRKVGALPPLADGILLDLGFSSDQLDDPQRGLSYHFEGPLDMRLNSSMKKTAADVLNTSREEELADIFYVYGEEPKSRVLARLIVKQRKAQPFETTKDLLAAVEQVYPPKLGLKRAHPAARIFQALRVAVNDELAVLERALPDAAWCLKKGGVLAVISFQPLEERAVKAAFRRLCLDELDEIGRVKTPAKFKMGKKIVPSDAEIDVNPRARSAILRTLERVG